MASDLAGGGTGDRDPIDFAGGEGRGYLGVGGFDVDTGIDDDLVDVGSRLLELVGQHVPATTGAGQEEAFSVGFTGEGCCQRTTRH